MSFVTNVATIKPFVANFFQMFGNADKDNAFADLEMKIDIVSL